MCPRAAGSPSKTKSAARRVPAPPGTPTARDAIKPKSRRPKKAIVSPEDRERFIAEAAYFRAERRGFTPGDEMSDWLEAEAEIDALLTS